MPHTEAARTATRERDAGRYRRHRPEQTLLYRIVEQHYPVFTAHLAEQGGKLPAYVRREFEDYLNCGRLEHGFQRVRCESCHIEHLVALIQRFGSALNLNIHGSTHRPARNLPNSRIPSPTGSAFFLERQGLLERDAENGYLTGDAVDEDPMAQLLGHSIIYRIAVGPQAGRKVFTLQTLSTYDEPFDDGVGKVAGFSLHAGVAARADERKKLERLCRCISRPAVSEKRLSLTPNGNIRYQLKTPYQDDTTHVIFAPMDFIARLAALAPKPRVNLT